MWTKVLRIPKVLIVKVSQTWFCRVWPTVMNHDSSSQSTTAVSIWMLKTGFVHVLCASLAVSKPAQFATFDDHGRQGGVGGVGQALMHHMHDYACRCAHGWSTISRHAPLRRWHVTSHRVMQTVLTRQASTSRSSSVGWDWVEMFTAAVLHSDKLLEESSNADDLMFFLPQR